MRRMRDWNIEHYIAAAVPVFAAAFGIHHWVNHGHPSGTAEKDAAVVIKPSQFSPGDRKIASDSGEKDGPRRHSHGDGSKAVIEAESDPSDADSSARSPASTESGPSAALAGAANDAVAAGAECGPIEYRGDGPVRTQITKGEWTIVMDQFHVAKRELLSWLEKHHHELSESSVQAMEHQLRLLKIQRPPASEEPDLSWRGIGVYSLNSEGEPIIKLGGGFVRMASSHPARAHFEMARLAAQAWAPCELQRVSALDATWSPLLKCLGETQAQECGQGTYSEAGWAVSTTLAAAVWPPGCQIPAFKTPEMAKCLRSFPTRSVASEGGRQ